jgi:hypothetical protein
MMMVRSSTLRSRLLTTTTTRLFSDEKRHAFEYTAHDLVPKDTAATTDPSPPRGVMHHLGLSEGAHTYPLWETLTREIMLHMQSREFREEFLSLVRNDEIHIRLFSLHLYLLNERLQAPFD